MSQNIVTRFAPSPTGFLHLGSARTALFSWAFARHHQGRFILRIEDTDLERSTPESVQAILEGMDWLGLDYDEGPYYQTRRMGSYQVAIEKLLAEGHAYRCTCSKERLEALRTGQMERQEKPRYDGHCRDLALDKAAGAFVVRFKNPLTGSVEVDDAVHGKVTFQNTELDDLIIARSDGVPTYNFCVVIDDWEMNVTHVIRGDDHLNNTPRQINMLHALGGTVPRYAHLPMILGADGKRLSKRHGAVSVQEFAKDGILPEALLSYLMRLGFSYGVQEIFSKQEAIELFDLDRLNCSAAQLNPERLLWVNQHFLKSMPEPVIAERLKLVLEKELECAGSISIPVDEKLMAIVSAQKERVKTLLEMADKSRYFFVKPTPDAALWNKHVTPEVQPTLAVLAEQLQALPQWSQASLQEVLKTLAESSGLGFGKLAQPLRVILTGGTVSPPMDATLFILGREESLKRLLQEGRRIG